MSVFIVGLVPSCLEKRGTRSHLDNPLLPQLGLAIWSDWVKDYTVLSTAQSGHANHTYYLLSHGGNVCLPVCHGHQPLLPCASVSTTRIPEGAKCTHMQRFLREAWKRERVMVINFYNIK